MTFTDLIMNAVLGIPFFFTAQANVLLGLCVFLINLSVMNCKKWLNIRWLKLSYFILQQDINKKILSLDYTSFRVEILSADAQPSYKEGVMVVVTGCLTGSDNLKRKFTQSFFLAPQDKGYYVLNDVFRYVDEYKSVDIESVPANDAAESAPTDAFTPEPGNYSIYIFWL